jgi:ABC-type lipoprotein release transport system permease subunit
MKAEKVTQPPAVRSLAGVAGRVIHCWWPQLAAVAAAAAVITITIVGSLGVGDSLQQGLQQLVADRLGGIVAAVIGREPFQADLAERMVRRLSASGTKGPAFDLLPAFALDISVERPADGRRSRAAAVAKLLACDHPDRLGYPQPVPPAGDGVAVSHQLAELLDLSVGEPVILRVAERSAVPADTPLGRRATRSRSRRLKVTAVLPPGSVGDFSLRPSQSSGGVALVSLALGQALLDQPDRANLILAVPQSHRGDAKPADAVLRQALAPTLADYGLKLTQLPGQAGVRLTSRRLLLEPAVDRAAAAVLTPLGGVPSFVFLANEVRPVDGGAAIPYSTVLGITDRRHPLGRLVDASGDPLPLPVGDEVIVDQWLVDDLAAQGRPVAVGDELELTCFLAETLHGEVAEQTCRCRISGIAAMQGLATARETVPTVAGITDEDSIADWDPPFPFDRTRVRSTPPDDQDDRYWKAYGATPKLFMPLERSRQIAGSRFGSSTAWHLPPLPTGMPLATVADKLAAAIPPAAAGIEAVPLARIAAAAAAGSTPFGLLFLALSSFVIGAGLVLLWLLFGLLVASRQRALGILAAVGWSPHRLAGLLMAVSAVAILGGAGVGMLGGPLWSQLLLRQLGRGWASSVAKGSEAVFTGGMPSVLTVVIGAGAAVLVGAAAVFLAALRAGRRPPLALLRGAGFSPVGRLRRFRGTRPLRSLVGLAGRGVAWRSGRGLAVTAMVGLAEFLIIFVAGFELTTPGPTDRRDTPTGGWSHLVRFAAATSIDPSRPERGLELGLTDAQQQLLATTEIAMLRSSQGDDASCTNLYATTQPLVLGLPTRFIAHGGFRFASHLPLSPGQTTPWDLLQQPRVGSAVDEPVPVILDAATAAWALKLGGVGGLFRLSPETGQVVPADRAADGAICQIVGLLEPGVLQGAILLAEADFTRLYPFVSGYRQAAVAVPESEMAGRNDTVVEALTTAWADAGATIEPAADRLRRLFAVQNTFLTGFQTLGTLGLLLGTAGVAAVAIQGAIERRGSLSVLHAIGFTRWRLAVVLWLESLFPVVLGLMIGGGSGLLAAAPMLQTARRSMPWVVLFTSTASTLLVASLAGLLAVWLLAIPRRPVEE